MKKFLIISLVLILAVFIVMFLFSLKPVSKARLTIDGTIIREFQLKENCTETFNVNGADITIEIKNGAARFTHSNCPDKICVNTGYIKSITQTAVCLPNHAVLEIIE